MPVRGWRLVCAFVLAFVVLACRADRVGLASGYLDPLTRIGAQDEALYSHSALRMARQGDWLTPRFLGRYALYKPPLLLWLAGASVKIFGPSPLALRLPSLLAGALTGVLVFYWVSRWRSPLAAAAALLLFLLNPLTHILSRMCLTDALLGLCLLGAMLCWWLDPRLETRACFWGFALLTAAAILTKSVAGLLPLAAVAAGRTTAPRRWIALCLAAAAVALPWHAYQLAVHPHWFWAEYVQSELVWFGAGSPPQTSPESHLGFYLKRLFLTDPALCLLALLAAPAAWRARHSRLLFLWIAAIAAGILAFRYRNITYLLPLVPSLAILAGCGLPPRVTASAALLCCLKLAFPQQPWGLSYPSGSTIPSAPLLESYAGLRRPTELILIAPDEHLFSTVLPLPRVRYCFLGDLSQLPPQPLDFAHLGIAVSAEQFTQLEKWTPVFRDRLRAMDLDSAEPIASTIFARDSADVARIVRSRPSSDFFLPAGLIPDPETHDLRRVSEEKVFLFARMRVAQTLQ
ncbi:MAG: glycosyltransferase family 39 protein [Acidobacteria bacterium]|nr:glycosyltransferase family 39 protein [Acidobacteriota bacterium]MBI3469748.1 glycosyltransferase family 39 protein [Candidatus Solibacter usitatus]